jgi:hypothetical protein
MPIRATSRTVFTDYPLSAARIYREIQEQGFNGKYTIVKDYIRDISGLLAEAMRCNTQSGAASRPLFRLIGPEVEHRPLSVYEGLSGEVQP